MEKKKLVKEDLQNLCSSTVIRVTTSRTPRCSLNAHTKETKTYKMLSRVDWYTMTDVSEDRNTFILWVEQSSLRTA
jgi:hypothetical protein